MVRALILDADGVVVNGVRARIAFAREHDITPEMTDVFFRGAFRDCLVGRADLREALLPHLPAWGWRAGIDDFMAFWFSCERDLDEAVLGRVSQLRRSGVPCFLATNQERHRTSYLTDVLGLGARFDRIFSSAEIGHTKELPEFWACLTKALSPIEPGDMLFFDDTEANVVAAKLAGLDAEVYTDVAAFEAALARRGLAETP